MRSTWIDMPSCRHDINKPHICYNISDLRIIAYAKLLSLTIISFACWFSDDDLIEMKSYRISMLLQMSY